MSSRIAGHLRSNIVGYAAVFIALSGTAYAVDGPLEGRNTVGEQDIINNEVHSADVRNDTLASGGLAAEDLRSGSVGGTEIQGDAVGSGEVAPDSLTGADITGLTGADVSNGGLTGQDVANNQLNSDDIFGLRGNDDIENGSLTGLDVALNTLGSEDVRQEGLRGEDIDEGTLDVPKVNGVSESEIFASQHDTGINDVSNPAYSKDGVTIGVRCLGTAQAVVEVAAGSQVIGSVTVASPDADLVQTRSFSDGQRSVTSPDGPGQLGYRNAAGVTVTFDFVLVHQPGGFGTTDDCFLFGHLRRSE